MCSGVSRRPAAHRRKARREPTTDETMAHVIDSVPAPVTRLLDAANANDTTAFLATFVEAGVVDDWGREFAGTDAIRGWSDREFIGKRVALDVRDIQRDGQAIVVTADVGGDGFNGLSHFSFLVDGDRVSRMTIRAYGSRSATHGEGARPGGRCDRHRRGGVRERLKTVRASCSRPAEIATSGGLACFRSPGSRQRRSCRPCRQS